MTVKRTRPALREVHIEDSFWSPWLDTVRTVMLPYVLDKMEEVGYAENYRDLAARNGAKHKGPPFSDGLLLESLRGACDFLSLHPDPVLEARIDGFIELFKNAMDSDGFLCTQTMQDYPLMRWGDNGGDIVRQHDLYDHGALIEAAIAHYLATGKTTLLTLAVRSANLICATIGKAPKKNIIPGHSLPEEAFVKLYRLFRDRRELDGLAAELGVKYENYLDMAIFWYEARGDRAGRFVSSYFSDEYNQDHATFSMQNYAAGHAVRAALCYTGAAAVTYETGNEAYKKALDAIWDNVYRRKLHISGGIGTRHDIEGFDKDYALPNDAYLETCAAIAFAFWAGEMSLLDGKSEYYEGFERALYNNILASVAPDGQHYFYENPLVSDGSIHRWAWHGCPCCPPMLLKLYSSLSTYIYTLREGEVSVNLLIGSRLERSSVTLTQKDGVFTADSHGKKLTLRIRVPAWAKNPVFTLNGETFVPTVEDGFALVTRVWDGTETLALTYTPALRRIFADPAVEDDRGLVSFFHGPYLLCAEAMDNGGSLDFAVAADPELRYCAEDDTVLGKRSDGGDFCLIPYYRWCRREGRQSDRAMKVWLPQTDMPGAETLCGLLGGELYGEMP